MDEKSMILILIIVLLFLPLYLTGKMFLVAAKDYMIRMKNRSNANKIINTLLILFAFTQISFSQATPAPAHRACNLLTPPQTMTPALTSQQRRPHPRGLYARPLKSPLRRR
jgi:hypothetical protein